jgi:hypothetical protein
MTRKARTWGAWLRRWTWRGVLWLVLVPGWLLTAAVLVSALGGACDAWLYHPIRTSKPVLPWQYDSLAPSEPGRLQNVILDVKIRDVAVSVGGELTREDEGVDGGDGRTWEWGIDAPIRVRLSEQSNWRRRTSGLAVTLDG